MDVLNRLIPRPNAANGAGFKRLKHSPHSGIDSTQIQSADDFFAIGGPSNGLADSLDECDQFALIPATNSPKIELGLVPKKQEEKAKSEQNGKMPWKNGKVKNKKAEKLNNLDPKKGQNGKREKSCEPNILHPNRALEGENGPKNGTCRCRTLLGSILPGGKKQEEKRNGGRLNPSMSEPQLNFQGGGFPPFPLKNGGHLDEQQIWDWEGGNGQGDRHRLYEEEKSKEKVGEWTKKKGAGKKMAPMAGAFKKVREKLPGKLGTNSNNKPNSGGISSELSLSTNSPNSSSSSPSSTSSSRSSIGNGIGRSKTQENGFPSQKEGKGATTTNTPTLAKLRKHAKIMDIVGKKEKAKNGGDFEGNRGNGNGNNQQSRKPVDAQHLLLFEESVAID